MGSNQFEWKCELDSNCFVAQCFYEMQGTGCSGINLSFFWARRKIRIGNGKESHLVFSGRNCISGADIFWFNEVFEKQKSVGNKSLLGNKSPESDQYLPGILEIALCFQQNPVSKDNTIEKSKFRWERKSCWKMTFIWK